MPRNSNIERIIAKIDNDFALDNTDWTPRIAAWVIDALSILKCTPTEFKTVTLTPEDKIITLPNGVVVDDDIKVYSPNGNRLKNCTEDGFCDCCKGDEFTSIMSRPLSNTLERVVNNNADDGISVAQNIAMDRETKGLIYITEEIKRNHNCSGCFIVLDSKRLELNKNFTSVKVKYKSIKTEESSMYGCELPVVPNNGLLIEAIVYYCMYKILCRGQKHPVFNLSASQYGTNPYFMWNTLKEKVKRSVMFDKQGNILEEDGDMWEHALQIFSFK